MINCNSVALISSYQCHYSESFFSYIFIFLLLKPEGRAGASWKPSNVLMLCLLPSIKASLTASVLFLLLLRNCVRL